MPTWFFLSACAKCAIDACVLFLNVSCGFQILDMYACVERLKCVRSQVDATAGILRTMHASEEQANSLHSHSGARDSDDDISPENSSGATSDDLREDRLSDYRYASPTSLQLSGGRAEGLGGWESGGTQSRSLQDTTDALSAQTVGGRGELRLRGGEGEGGGLEESEDYTLDDDQDQAELGHGNSTGIHPGASIAGDPRSGAGVVNVVAADGATDAQNPVPPHYGTEDESSEVGMSGLPERLPLFALCHFASLSTQGLVTDGDLRPGCPRHLAFSAQYWG